MLFPTTVFALFFAIVFACHWALEPRPRIRKVFLLGASLFFYAYWSWKFALMLVASALLNHVIGVGLDRMADARSRKRLMIGGVVLNVLLLAFFKYTEFLFSDIFVPLCIPLCKALGTTEQLIRLQENVLPFISTIVLPVGISFYTFEALSFVIDVYNRKTRPARTALDFVNYLAFFPNLLAGPITRAGKLVPQMETLPSSSLRLDTGRAATLILGGLFKKMVVANWLSQHLAEEVFNRPEAYSGIDTLLGVYGYTLQIYCDFSAYSDIAIGIALLLGFSFPVNFNAPYLSVTLQEFWRRWHISLSAWLRDYLYIPFGGSRCGKTRTKINLFLTFLIGGLWHGAGWTFILWGAFHGIYLSLERIVRAAFGLPEKPAENPSFCARWAGRIWIFHVACFSWILFRCETMEQVGLVLKGFLHWDVPVTLFSAQALLMLLLGFLLQVLDGTRPRRIWDCVNRWPVWVQGVVCALLLTLILGAGPSGVAPFIYFQF